MAENNTVARRGISTARGTQRLKFTHTDADKSCGLFPAHLESVDVSMIKIGEDRTGMPSFNGLEIPKIRFTFASNVKETAKRKYITLQFSAVESNIDTIPDSKDAWKVNSVFDYFKHILDVYVLKGRDLTDEEANALSLTFTDFDEDGNYVPVEPEVVIAGWKAVFDGMAKILNEGKDGKPYYMNNGNPLPIWIKLVRCIKTPKKGWINVQSNGDLSFPSFVGEGVIEIMVPNTLPSIHLDTIRESISPRVVEAPKAPTTLAAPMGGVGMPGAVAVDPFGAMDNGVPGITNDIPFGDMPAF